MLFRVTLTSASRVTLLSINATGQGGSTHFRRYITRYNEDRNQSAGGKANRRIE
jgi:hypothetical protein